MGAIAYLRKARDLLRQLAYGAAPDQPRADTHSVDVFDSPPYADITSARLQHLEALELPLSGRSVLDVGAGVGHFSAFFRSQGCRVHCVDARPENVARLRMLYPDVGATVMDVEADDLAVLGKFDVVMCYGLLYHLVDPVGALRKIAGVCQGILLLETCITDAQAPVLTLVPEDNRNPSQALGKWGSRPSPAFLRITLLQSGYEHLYCPRQMPNHAEFQYRPAGDHAQLRDGRPMRTIVVASRHPLDVVSLGPWAE
jgi:SAM-dependent methyltransferase